MNQVSVTDQDQLFLDLQMSFDETTVGGGINLRFDTGILQVVGVVFNGCSATIPNCNVRAE